MISSKVLLDLSGVSRATLNNYIQLGILPKPIVLSQPEDATAGAARLLGYFPEETVERIKTVQELKGQGFSMAEIVEYLSENELLAAPVQRAEVEKLNKQAASQKTAKEQTEKLLNKTAKLSAQTSGAALLNQSGALPPLSLENLDHPAYMLNYNLELTWLNEPARKDIFGFEKPPSQSAERNLFSLMSRAEVRLNPTDRHALEELHIKIASERLSREALIPLLNGTDASLYEIAETLEWPKKSDPSAGPRMASEARFSQTSPNGKTTHYRVFSVYFREGILIVFTLENNRGDELLDFLSRRDQVINKLLGQQLPVMTPLAVLVADIQSSVRICSELPPDEYFELINQIWHTMSQILRKYKGTHGKHAGDGVVYYFFPQPESNYLFNAIACASEIRSAMLKINLAWQERKNWLTELKLNIGLHEGQEWLGTFKSDHHVEFMVLGDTINHAARLSDFAQHGSIWATKNLVSRLSNEEREKIEFGVLRRSQESGDRFVPSSYAQINSLVSAEQKSSDKLRDIAQLAVTEIRRVNDRRSQFPT